MDPKLRMWGPTTRRFSSCNFVDAPIPGFHTDLMLNLSHDVFGVSMPKPRIVCY